MCEPDWSHGLKGFSPSRDLRLHNYCIDAKLVDADPNTSALDPDCIVEFLEPTIEPAPPPSCTPCGAGPVCQQLFRDDIYWTRTSVPLCDEAATVLPCWKLLYDTVMCPVNGQLVRFHRTVPPYTPAGTRLRIQCRVCPDPSSGEPAPPGCDY